MEKILLVINGQNTGTSSMDFACEMASLNQSKITGVFLKNLVLEDAGGAMIDVPFYLETLTQITPAIAQTNVDEAVTLFQEKCQHKSIESDVCVYSDQLIKNVVFESRFADLLIIDPSTGVYETDDKLPSHFVKEILVKAECPVLLAPGKFEDIGEIIFCYNNTVSSVFAIKQFTYLFPQFRYKHVKLLEVTDSDSDEFSEDRNRLINWLREYYNGVSYHTLRGYVEDELVNYFLTKRKKFIVMGAYGRSILSSFFKKSSADALIRMLDMPIFITHH